VAKSLKRSFGPWVSKKSNIQSGSAPGKFNDKRVTGLATDINTGHPAPNGVTREQLSELISSPVPAG
jgi:hypothetical protein